MTALPFALAVAAAFGQPADFRREEQSDLLQFEYGWPAAAEAVPALRERFLREMETAYVEMTGYAEEGRRIAAEHGSSPLSYYYAKLWEVAGDTTRLLSLSSSNETFTGGAHGNLTYAAILWDRAAAAPVEAAALFGTDALTRMTPRYCDALNDQRAENRGEPLPRNPKEEFPPCPPLTELVLVPRDGDGNGRFDRLGVLIAPYVAGSYAEGSFVIDVPFEEADLAGIADGYRPAFETGATPESAAQELSGRIQARSS